jgi:hypothetical protein
MNLTSSLTSEVGPVTHGLGRPYHPRCQNDPCAVAPTAHLDYGQYAGMRKYQLEMV